MSNNSAQALEAFKRINNDFYPNTLSEEEERELAIRYKEHGDEDAGHKIVVAHRRLVVKLAKKYAGYNRSVDDMIGDGHIGLMKALKKFDVNKGSRFSTYSALWIKAEIRAGIMGHTSAIKVPDSSDTRPLFFNLASAERDYAIKYPCLSNDERDQKLVDRFKCSIEDLRKVRGLKNGMPSLNVSVKNDSGENSQFQDFLVSEGENPEENLLLSDRVDRNANLISEACKGAKLKDRDIAIFKARRLSDDPPTLEELSVEYGVSRERVRQIEARVYEKLMIAVKEIARERALVNG